MSYVRQITFWQSGEPVVDGVAAHGDAGDFPQVHYDLARIAAEIDRDALPRAASTLWRYAPLLPVEEPQRAVSLGEGITALLPVTRLGESLGVSNLWAKDEGQNPSGTFKDRGASVAVTRLRELGIRHVIHNSSGNAAAAWALYTARAGLHCVNIVPSDVLPASLCQSTLSGADTWMWQGPWQTAGAAVAAATEQHSWFSVATLKEPHRLEGKKTMGLEIAEQLNWELPDAIVYPTGGGLGAIAIYKAFAELMELGWVAKRAMPKLIATQYAGCAPIVRAFDQGQEHAELWTELDVPAGGLKSTRPPGDRAVLKLLRETNGAAIAVSAEEALAAVTEMARMEGLFTSPEVGTAIAGVRHALRRGVIERGERVVIMCTGSGLKSVPLLPSGAVRHVAPNESIQL